MSTHFTVTAEGQVTGNPSVEQMADLAQAIASAGALAAMMKVIPAENAEKALLEMAKENEDLQKELAALAAAPLAARKGFLTNFRYPPRVALNAEQQKEKADVLVLCQTKYDPESMVHQLIFKSLYKFFTGYAVSENSRWSKIGLVDNGDFNSNLGPNVGMMGALQVLYLSEHYPEFAKKLYTISTDEKTKFPIVSVLTMISCEVYKAFVAGDVNRLVFHIPEKTVMRALLKFYCAAVFKFDKLWSAKKYKFDMVDCILQAVKSCAKDPVAKVSKYLLDMKGIKTATA